jgi:uracil-DNA glycosylase
MKDLKTLLRDADPVAREGGLEPDAVSRMRVAVVAVARAADRRSTLVSRQLAMAACLTAMVLTGVVAARRVPDAANRGVTRVAMSPSATDRRTQIHFSTPGGTRIVWTLDPAFQLREPQP